MYKQFPQNVSTCYAHNMKLNVHKKDGELHNNEQKSFTPQSVLYTLSLFGDGALTPILGPYNRRCQYDNGIAGGGGILRKHYCQM